MRGKDRDASKLLVLVLVEAIGLHCNSLENQRLEPRNKENSRNLHCRIIFNNGKFRISAG